MATGEAGYYGAFVLGAESEDAEGRSAARASGGHAERRMLAVRTLDERHRRDTKLGVSMGFGKGACRAWRAAGKFNGLSPE